MGINFISPFERYVYENTYIYNLINYFSRYIYPHLIVGANINNIILLSDHYLQTNSKSYAVYIDVD